MINKDLESYVTLFQGAVSQDVCRKTCEELDKVDWQQHTFYNVKTNSYKATEKELSVFFNQVSTKPHLTQLTHDMVKQYVLDLNFPWYNGWVGYTDIRFNRYVEQTNMKLHCDHIQSMFDGEKKGIPTLSIVGNLNSNYEGAEFVMWDQVIHLDEGDVLMFPSNFMYPHLVRDCTKGTRYSFVSWVY
jgi:hypothetical protein